MVKPTFPRLHGNRTSGFRFMVLFMNLHLGSSLWPGSRMLQPSFRQPQLGRHKSGEPPHSTAPLRDTFRSPLGEGSYFPLERSVKVEEGQLIMISQREQIWQEGWKQHPQPWIQVQFLPWIYCVNLSYCLPVFRSVSAHEKAALNDLKCCILFYNMMVSLLLLKFQ